jgi:hypothetical protein
MIKIISGWSEAGGSTTAHINLCNALNERGVETKFFGPHDFSRGKCNFGNFSELSISEDDNLIFHFLQIPDHIKAKKIVLSVHEQNLFNLATTNLKKIDTIHFVSRHQSEYHNIKNYNKPYFILSNVMDKLLPNPKTKEKAVGIIGSIDENKQVHISIQKAIADGFKDITLFGKITDPKYFEIAVKPLMQKYKIKGPKFSENKQEMYDNITDVYFSSVKECKPFVIGECKLTGTNLHTIEGKNYTNEIYETEPDIIVNKWKEVFEI